MSEVLIRALADAQTKIDKRDRKIEKLAGALAASKTKGGEWHTRYVETYHKLSAAERRVELAKVDESDAQAALIEAEDRVAVLEAATAAQDVAADAMLAKIRDAVYGHGHEYSTILWKVRQIVGPE